MSTWQIRPISIPEDFTRLAAIFTAINPEQPVTVAQLEADEKRPSAFWNRAVVTDAAGLVVGYGFVRHFQFEQEGRFYLKVFVDPAHREHGAGGTLLRYLEEWLTPHNPVTFETMTREKDPAGVAFAERRGFVTFQHVFESSLDPNTFDAAPYAGVVEAAGASGIRFFTLAEDTSEEAVRKLYDFYALCGPDTPNFRLASYPTFEQWRGWMIDTGSTCREGMILAAEGDRIVGCNVMVKIEGTNDLYIDFTGVDRAHRGRHLALALKLLGIRTAKALGVARIRTSNDSHNAPMLAVNRKLGFIPEPGTYYMERQVR